MYLDLEHLGGGWRDAVASVAAVLPHVFPADPGYVQRGTLGIRS